MDTTFLSAGLMEEKTIGMRIIFLDREHQLLEGDVLFKERGDNTSRYNKITVADIWTM